VELKRPHVLLLDLGFPDGDSLASARELTASHSGTRIVVLTGSDSLDDARRALDAGVAGYLRKDERIDRIIDALERCASGERVVDEQLLRRLARQPVRSAALREGNLLTPRERDVARLLQAGLNTAEMVEQLGIRESTVRRHVQAIFAKLSVHSRIEAVACLGDVPARRAHAVAGS
jgi:DNA-binding NarL/FixJ family response regulator